MNESPAVVDLTSIDAEKGFFDEFPRPTKEEWMAEVISALKGAPFEKVMRTPTYEGITLEPIYLPEDMASVPHLSSRPGFSPLVRGSEPEGYLKTPWVICQELGESNPEAFNEEARHDLSRGQTGLTLVIAPSCLSDKSAPERDERGLFLFSMEDLETALAGIDPGSVYLLCHGGASVLPLAAAFSVLWGEEKLRNFKGCIGCDPLSLLAVEGTLPISLSVAYDAMAQVVGWAGEQAPMLRTVLIQGSTYHDAGASAVQEAAFALATGAAYVREMLSRGLSVDQAAGSMVFGFSLGSNFFMEIAKLRAVKMLWEKIVAAFGGGKEACRMHIHARTSRINKTLFDPYVNMLRITSEGFSGAVGGIESMHLDPFDAAIRLPDRFSRRVARNVQIMLQEEARFTMPIDMAGGAYCVEKLTDEVARAAWGLFQDMEKAGGMAQAVMEGLPQRLCAETAAKRASAMAMRKDILLGTNMYANLGEKKLAPRASGGSAPIRRRSPPFLQKDLDRMTLSVDAAASLLLRKATFQDLWGVLARRDASFPTGPMLAPFRAAENFEKLRERSACFQEKTGFPLSIFLANMGPVPQHKPRADFCIGFFEVAGFAMLNNGGFETVEAAMEAALSSRAPIVVICSSDASYPECVPDLARGLKAAAPKVTVIVAGKQSPEAEAEFRACGVDDFIHVRSNCYEINRMLQDRYTEGKI